MARQRGRLFSYIGLIVAVTISSSSSLLVRRRKHKRLNKYIPAQTSGVTVSLILCWRCRTLRPILSEDIRTGHCVNRGGGAGCSACASVGKTRPMSPRGKNCILK
ncbi:hypothetical protein EV126DRAFT_147348 [Verticillium dahliae]|nr:hypothetical protein EV126DRAFT_147348 [Verticillium dahliae]